KLGLYLNGFDPTLMYQVNYQVRGTTYNIQVVGPDGVALSLDVDAASNDSDHMGTGHGGNDSWYIGGMFDVLHVVDVVTAYASAAPGGEGHIDAFSPFGIGVPLHGIEYGLSKILPNGTPGSVMCSIMNGCN